MSNLIKYPFVNLKEESSFLVKYDGEPEYDPNKKKESKVKKQLIQEIEKENRKVLREDFEAGIPVQNFDEVFKEREEEARKQAEDILEEARRQAEMTLSDARLQKDEIIVAAREEGMNIGIEEGRVLAAKEMEPLRLELEERERTLQEKYDKIISEIEPKYVDVLCNLIRKLTGVFLNDQKDVLLHLIRSGISAAEPSRRFIIRVSSDDLGFLESTKDEIQLHLGDSVGLEIEEEKGLHQGEIILETDTQMIDCGIKTQVENLVSTLKMLI